MLLALNSFQVRLYAIVLLLVLLLGLTIGVGSRSASNLAARGETVNAAASLRTSTYLLAGLARRLATATTDTERANVAQLMREAVDSFDRTSAAIRSGSADIPAVNNREVEAILDELDLGWQSYRTTLNEYMDGLMSGTQEAVWLLDSIDSQSAGVFTYADQITGKLRELTEAEEQALNQLFFIAIVLALVFAVMSILVVFSSVQAMNRLAATAEAFARGDLSVRASTTTVNEIARAGAVFNKMADDLARLIDELRQRVIEARAAQESAERADKVKSAFLASMSHELRTPLNSVINYTRFVSKGVMGPVNDRQIETLGKVVESGKHLLNLINDVLDVSKIESGSLSLFLEDNVDVGELVRLSVATTEGLLENKPVKVQVAIDGALPLIRGDRQRIRQVLLNILSNACKFTDEGEIYVRASLREDSIMIAIKDSGPGISPEERITVFEAFKQTEAGLRQGGGTGLGMPISRSLAEAHGGRLWFESEPGKGTTFYVTLPVNSDQPAPVTA